MGVVFEAVDREHLRRVALKMLRNDLDVSEEDRRRFRAESSAMARLRHPGIVPVFEVGCHDGIDYFTMELIEGVSFDAWLRTLHRTYRERVAIVAQISHALAHAHNQGVIHRDLKPANILIDASGVARVTDFGLARTLDNDVARTRLTEPGRTVGTPAYMSPEQARGQPTDSRCDVWGLGAILYEALTGRPPYVGESTYVVMNAVVTDPPLPPRKLDRSIPRELEAVTLHCLEKNAHHRYAGAQELADDLERWLAGQPVRAKHASLLRRCGQKLHRHRLVASLLLAIVLVAGAFAAYGLLEHRRTRADWIPVYFQSFNGGPEVAAPVAPPSGIGFYGFNLEDAVRPWPQSQDGLHVRPDQWLWLKDLHVVGDVRVTIELSMRHPDGVEICLDSRQERLAQDGLVPTGYSCQFAGYHGSVDLISRNPLPRLADINTAVDSRCQEDVLHTVVIERQGESLALSVDGQMSVSDEDPLPLTGSGLDGIGLRTYCPDLVLRSLRVERLALPEKASPLIAGDALVQAGSYQEAIGNYLSVARDHPGGSLAELALTKAYFASMRTPSADPVAAASIRHELDASFPSTRYLPRLQELDAIHAWNHGDFTKALALLAPIYAADRHARTAVRLISANHPRLGHDQVRTLLLWIGASSSVRDLDLSFLNLDALAGLEPLALRSLRVSGNSLDSLAPLMRMPLETLDCASNHLQDLQPLSAMPLRSLYAGDNLITSVEPLASCTSLVQLDLSNNSLSSLKPIAQLPLALLIASGNVLGQAPVPNPRMQDLELDRCSLGDLAPLAGSHLQSLRALCNRIGNLAPLSGSILTELRLDMNQVADLGPLARCPHLDVLSVGANKVASLAPLAGLPLKRLYCEDNLISDLSPLRGSHLESLRCAGNQVQSLEPLLASPPPQFLYDGGDFPLPEIERARERWLRDGRTMLASQASVLLAVRHGDVPALLRRAHHALGHAWLLIPMAVTWEDASAHCQALGGHLATISGEGDMSEVVSVMESMDDAWIGLRIAGDDTRWDDGSPLTFQAIPSFALRRTSGPVHMNANLRLWFVRDFPRQRMPFVIEWDEVQP